MSYTIPSLVSSAIDFGQQAHKDQKRKYTNEPYFYHCHEVAALVATVTDDEEMIAAAYLHDTVEDTGTSLGTIETLFDANVASLVEMLTDVSKPSDGNRKQRKELDRLHLAKASPKAKTIKLADLISNAKNIVEHDRDFAVVYLREKEELLPYLKEGNPVLFQKACDMLMECKLKLMENE